MARFALIGTEPGVHKLLANYQTGVVTSLGLWEAGTEESDRGRSFMWATHGGAENAGRENEGREIDGPICRTWKCRNEIAGHKRAHNRRTFKAE